MLECPKCSGSVVVIGPWQRCSKCGFFVNTIDKRTPEQIKIDIKKAQEIPPR